MSSIGRTLSFKQVHKLSRYFSLGVPSLSRRPLFLLPPDLQENHAVSVAVAE